MIYLRKANERGHANHGWLDSWHTFSFANYYDPNFMGFSALRVINDDVIDAGQGFGTHPHKDMEILTYVLEGAVEHQDSMGNKEQVPAGEFQIMSAGTGVRHSEYNPSKTDRLRLYQIWIIPEETGITPRYEQRRFDAAQGKQLVLSPDARDGSLKVYQDMELYRWALLKDEQSVHQIAAERRVWIQVVKGEVTINGTKATTSDGLAIWDEQAMLDAGMTPYSVMVEQSSSYSSGIELMRQARREYPQLDGIFCTNDDLAVGAAFECQRLGLKIPDDMAIAGFHGHDIGQVMEPRLASVLTPRERMGRIGAERLLARIRGEAITPKMLDLGFTLSPGGSI